MIQVKYDVVELYKTLQEGQRAVSVNGITHHIIKSGGNLYFCTTNWDIGNMVTFSDYIFKMEFVIAPTPVTFEEAMAALDNGKWIRVECEGFNPCEYQKVIDDVLDVNVLVKGDEGKHRERTKCNHFSYGQIKNGKWFIIN